MKDTSECRGMSEPIFFAFDIQKGTNMVVAHGIIFTSFLISDKAAQAIGGMDKDPRFEKFMHYVLENHGRKAKEALKDHILRGVKELNDLELRIQQLRKELKTITTKKNE